MINNISYEDMGADMLLVSSLGTPLDSDQDNGFLELSASELDNLFSAYDETTQLYTSVNTAMESGQGLNVTSLRLASISLESIYKRNNLNFPTAFLAIEGFENKVTRLSATRLSLENIITDLYKIAKALWRAINLVWEKIKAVVVKLYKQLKGLDPELKQLLEDIEGIPNNAKPSSQDLTVSNEEHATVTPLMNRIPFAINGKCDGHSALKITDTTLVLVKSHLGIIERIVKCLENVAKDSTEEALIQEIDNIVDFIMQNFSKLDLKHKKIVDNKVEYTYGHLVAGKDFELTEYVSKGHHEQERRIFNLDVHITLSDQTKTFVPAVLTKKEMQELAKQSIELVKAVASLDEMIPLIEKALNKAEGYFFTKQDQQQSARIGLLVVRDLFRYTGATLPKISIDSNRVASSVANYVRDSIALYK